MGLRTPSHYQPNNLKIAAVMRPAIIAERMSSAKVNILSTNADGLRRRRFSFRPIGLSPFFLFIEVSPSTVCIIP